MVVRPGMFPNISALMMFLSFSAFQCGILATCYNYGSGSSGVGPPSLVKCCYFGLHRLPLDGYIGAFSGLLAFGISLMKGIGGKEGWSWIFVSTYVSNTRNLAIDPSFT